MTDLLELVAVILLVAAWPLLLLGLPLFALIAAWRRRWRRAGLALAGLAVLLFWSLAMPAIHRYRMEAALQRGGLIGAVPETLQGTQALLFGAVDGRMDVSPCAGLLGHAGVARLWQADPSGTGTVPVQPIITGVYDPGQPGAMCGLRQLEPGDAPQPEWALLPEDRGALRVVENPAFDAMVTAHLGKYAARRVRLAYLLAPMDGAGRVQAEQAALVGFQAVLNDRPWWWPPYLPFMAETLRPEKDPALDRLRALICGGDWPCDY